MKVWQGHLVTIGLIGAIGLFSIHLIDQWLGRVRVDMTSENLYSLTEGSEAILSRMSEEGTKPLQIDLYFSETAGKTLPRFIKDFITYERYIRSLLGEYARASGRRIGVDFIDPVPDSDEAQLAADAGLDGKLINQNGDLFYFGLVFETQTGSREVIDFLWPSDQENIEYEISKTIHNLIWPSRQRVGVLSSLEVFGSAQDPFMAQMLAAQGRQPTQKWVSLQVLEELYEVKQIETTTDSITADDYDLVIVIHPKDLPGKTLAALDDWVVRGGNTLVFLDAYALDDRPPQNPQQPWAALQYKPSSNLEPLLAAWGLERPEDRFAADFELAVRRPVNPTGGAESMILDLAISEDEVEDTLDTSQPMLRGLVDLRFLLAGVLEKTDSPSDSSESSGSESAEDDADGEAEVAANQSGSGLKMVPLITTTARGNSITVQPGFGGQGGLAFTDFNSPAKLRDEFSPGTAPVALAYFVRGRFPSAYPDGAEYPAQEPERPPGLPPGIDLPPPADAEMIRKEPVAEEDRADGAAIVFSDVDFIADQLAFVQSPFGLLQAANDNHRVLLNAVDFLLGSEALMAIRATKTLSRPFKLFDEIESAAEMETLERERQIRADIEAFQEELRTKQSDITSRNAALFQKRVQDEVDDVNKRIAASNQELREIRQSRRRSLERQESMVRFSVMGWMPVALLIAGVYLAQRRRARALGRESGSSVTADSTSQTA